LFSILVILPYCIPATTSVTAISTVGTSYTQYLCQDASISGWPNLCSNWPNVSFIYANPNSLTSELQVVVQQERPKPNNTKGPPQG